MDEIGEREGRWEEGRFNHVDDDHLSEMRLEAFGFGNVRTVMSFIKRVCWSSEKIYRLEWV